MGISIRTNVPVSQEIFVRFLATVELSIAAMMISSLIGILAGVISSVRKYSVFDYCLHGDGLGRDFDAHLLAWA